MDEKKPSTSDILAKIRAQKAAAAGAAPAETPKPAAVESVAAAPTPESPAPAAATPAAPAAKPGSTKDILAAIRAKGAGGATASPAVPAAVESAPSAPAAAKPVAAAAGPRPSVQDMLKAVREGKAGAAVVAPAASGAAKPVVTAPPMPAKPVSAASKKAPAPQRRSLSAIVSVALVSLGCFVGAAITGSWFLFLVGMLVWSLLMSPFMAAWAAMAEVGALGALETARFMMPNVLVEPPSKFKVGPLSDYPLNSVSNKWKDQYGVWIVHTDQYEGQNLIFALASVCTHLGCTPSWLDGEQKFKCPCHGSGFYITGVNFEGPAPRPLERMGLKIAEGMLEVDKSMKFQEEMGQWTDPASFVAVS
eukprot:TRINITY_DN729_c0_g1_i2.p1 TRINITY_DN729_c0_g1~~TRINITY_DN729_c0_g1_i2.p1  ORF type:complete len:363 (+),score=63.92 TRINITY_DN729_c0_g1_i2:3066-4154(+)